MSREARVRIASRTEEREIPSRSQSAASVGIGSPGASPSSRISSWMRSTAVTPLPLLRTMRLLPGPAVVDGRAPSCLHSDVCLRKPFLPKSGPEGAAPARAALRPARSGRTRGGPGPGHRSVTAPSPGGGDRTDCDVLFPVIRHHTSDLRRAARVPSTREDGLRSTPGATGPGDTHRRDASTVITNPSGRLGRRGFLRGTAAFAGAAGIVAGIGACAPRDGGSAGSSDAGGATAGEATPDGHIAAAISYGLGTNGYDPMTTSAALTVAVNWHTLEGLTELHPVTREAYAALATEVPATDGTSVDIALREGAVFHDGTPVTPEDVVFSFERVQDPANASLYAQFITFVESFEKKDDTTVTFTLAHPTAVLAERLSTVKIVPKAAVEADPDAFDSNPVGSGPWKMTDNSAASKIVEFERFDDYTGPMPAKAKTMSWQVIPDPSTRTNALQSQTVQAIDSVPYLSIDQLRATGEGESVGGFG